MDEYGVPPKRVGALLGKGWYLRYHTIRTSRDTHELIIVYFRVICNGFVCRDGESACIYDEVLSVDAYFSPRSWFLTGVSEAAE